MSNNKIKFNAIQMIDGEDNIFHKSVTEDVDFISVPIETNNLSNLIELTARNIRLIYKFSG